jgi:hypothetical protein
MEPMVENNTPQADTVETNVISASEFFASAAEPEATTEQEPTTPEPRKRSIRPRRPTLQRHSTRPSFDAEVKTQGDYISRGVEKKFQSDPRLRLPISQSENGERDPAKAAESGVLTASSGRRCSWPKTSSKTPRPHLRNSYSAQRPPAHPATRTRDAVASRVATS